MPRSKRPMKAKGQKEVFTYSVLRKVAKHALANAESGRDGAMWDRVMVVLASAFFMEAYLNHVGAILFEDWETLLPDTKPKAWFSPDEKLRLICGKLKIAIDGRGKRHRAFVDAFQVRKALVHGRNESLSGEWDIGVRGTNALDGLKTNWERVCTPPRARIVYDELCAFVIDVHIAAGLGAHPFLSIMSGGGQMPAGRNR